MRRQLSRSVVVVTGASSGLGAAAAVAFAEQGAHVVLAARTASALEAVAERCRREGVVATAVPTDVGDPAQVEALARAAVDRHGRIDTWVNAAGVLVAGRLGSEPVEELERLVRTNVAGPLYGARAALAQFREQGDGVLIDVGSLLGVVPNPLVPSYVMSKFAIRGLSLSLYHEVRTSPATRACVVLPGPIDTPIFQRAANHSGRQLRAIPPAMSVERVAAKVVSCARRPRREAVVGLSGHAIRLGARIAPGLTRRVVAAASARLLVRSGAADDTPGALASGLADGRADGGWRRWRWRRHGGDVVGRLLRGRPASRWRP